jgi:NAD(P)-dependent dehydrogenase (short-subunit alcohol dehydrogenase family)
VVAEPGDPVMIVGGGGAIALSTAQELCALQGHRVVVLWRRDPDLARAVESIGAVFITAARPDSAEGLDRAGVHHAVTILALSPDDHLNLHAALLARDINPRIRIVLRQFNRTLAHKIEQNLPNCSVLSLAWHSAATLWRGRNRPVLLSRAAVPGARRPADRICDADRRRLRGRRRYRRARRAGAGGAAHCDRRRHPLLP